MNKERGREIYLKILWIRVSMIRQSWRKKVNETTISREKAIFFFYFSIQKNPFISRVARSFLFFIFF